MDPFSILAGSSGLLDVSLKVIKYLNEIKESVGRVEEDIVALSGEIDTLVTVNDSIEKLWLSNHDCRLGSARERDDAEELWKRLADLLRHCRNTALKLEVLLKEVIGKNGPRVPGKFDGIKKALRKQSKDREYMEVRNHLSSHQAGLQMLLSAISVLYTRSSSTSSELMAGSLERLHEHNSALQSQMESLRLKLEFSDGVSNRKSINPAQAVTPLESFNQYFDLPQTVSSIFTGQDAQLQELKDMLDDSTPVERSHSQKRFVIYGLGGSGKTQFCCKFAQDNREFFWGVFWIDGSSHENAKHSFSKIAKMGGAEPNENAAKDWLSSLQHPWLLLIDNADNPDLDVTRYFPRGERGVIIMTTRNPSNKVHGTIGRGFFHFEQLQPDDASSLLLKAASFPVPGNPESRTSASRIAKILGYLPLALIHAGKAIMDGLCSLSNYPDFYDRALKRIRKARTMAGHRGEIDLNMNVYSTWEIVYLGLEAKKTQTAEDSVQLLKMFSFFYWENIGVDILIAAAQNPRIEEENASKMNDEPGETIAFEGKKKSWAQAIRGSAIGYIEQYLKPNTVLPDVLMDNEFARFDEDRLRRALTLLAQMGMLTHHTELDSYWMHPLVHTWVRERPQTSTGEQAIWCQAAATTLSSCIFFEPLSDNANLDEKLKTDILIHVENVRKLQNTIRDRIIENQKTRQRSWIVSWFFPAVAPVDMQPLQWVKFSLVYLHAGIWEEAEKLQLPVKELICQKLGMEHLTSIRIMMLLSITYGLQSRNNKASIIQRQALDACTKLYGPNHPRTLKIVDTLGGTCLLQSRWKEARRLHEKAVDGLTAVYGSEHEDTLIAVDNLGKVMSRYFYHNQSKDLHLKSFAGMKKTLGPTHLRTLQAQEHLTHCYLYLGELDTAHKLAKEVLEVREKKCGREHPYTLMAVLMMARIKTAMGEYEEGERLIRSGLVIGVRNLGDNHLGILLARVWLSQALVKQKQYVEAEELLKGVVERHHYEASQGEDRDHTDRLHALWFLIQCYEIQGKIEKAMPLAEELCEGVQDIVGETFGQDHFFVKKADAKREELRAKMSSSQEEVSPKTNAESTRDDWTALRSVLKSRTF